MVESEIGELDEATTLGAVKFGFDAQQTVIKAINDLVARAGKERWAIPEKTPEYVEMEKRFEQFAPEIEKALGIKEKLVRLDTLAEIHAKAKARIPELFPETTTATSTLESWADEIVENITARIMRSNILAGRPRIDGRDLKLAFRRLNDDLAFLSSGHVRDLECAFRYGSIGVSQICLAVELVEMIYELVYEIHSGLTLVSEDDSVDRLEYDALVVDVFDLAESVSCRVILDLLRSECLLDVLPCCLCCSK